MGKWVSFFSFFFSLEGSTPLSMQGKTKALSLLFPMEVVFEKIKQDIQKSRWENGCPFFLFFLSMGKWVSFYSLPFILSDPLLPLDIITIITGEI